VAKGARAYGVVSTFGSLSRSKNVASVSRPADGVYCITLAGGINPATAFLVVSTDVHADSTNTLAEDITHAEWDSSASSCPSGALEVQTFVLNGDPIDDDDGGGNTIGTDLELLSEPFQFVVP
jgi:hypothetical protein